MTAARVWLVLAVFAGALTVERFNAMFSSGPVLPGVSPISVVGIFEALVAAELTGLLVFRWWDVRTGTRRRWGWLFGAALSSLLTLLLVGAATLASRPGGLAPSGLVFVAAGIAITAFAFWRSGRA